MKKKRIYVRAEELEHIGPIRSAKVKNGCLHIKHTDNIQKSVPLSRIEYWKVYYK